MQKKRLAEVLKENFEVSESWRDYILSSDISDVLCAELSVMKREDIWENQPSTHRRNLKDIPLPKINPARKLIGIMMRSVFPKSENGTKKVGERQVRVWRYMRLKT